MSRSVRKRNPRAVIVGAGVWGSTLARLMAEDGVDVELLDARPFVGGNARAETDAKTGIEVHVYGSHIFHTALPEVWRFVNRFTEFNGYRHKVLARHAGRTYFMPPSLALVNQFFGVDLDPAAAREFMAEPAHRQALFDAFFRHYTAKQWGMDPERVDPAIIRRVPVRTNWDIGYFNDPWQGIPLDGYQRFFERMLDHPRITLRLGVEFTEADFVALSPNDEVYYSGPIDRLFDYRLGRLAWRSLRFEIRHLSTADFQGTAVVNYPDADVRFTRIHEYKHYHPERTELMALDKTVVCREYPVAWRRGLEPYYPVRDAASLALHARYLELARSGPCRNFTVGGRLGGYEYLDMDKAIASAMACHAMRKGRQ